jgi:hypothetical protein
MGFREVQLRPSGRFCVECQCDGRRYWLGTFESADIAARAYDIMVWHLSRPIHEMNLKEIESLEQAEFVGPKDVGIRPINEKTKKKMGIHIASGENDEVVMTWFARESLQYVQYELAFFWKRDLEKKMKQVKQEDEAGPSTMIPI